jgi:rhamnose utilization protein RhaD (predicted bifunctional aldolase and dehydrogenase)/NAD(P)-dependent dehydrogenase (short-subunit alcohol dehydrogenase family)
MEAMIDYLWVDADAEACIKDHSKTGINPELALRVYTSKLIGCDPDLVMHGGGNTSCKTTAFDWFGREIQVLCVKGSGWDLGNIEAPGLPAVRLENLLELRKLEVLNDEDMVNALRSNLMDQASPNPSVEALLHAFIPHKVIDHTHATPFLALANLPDPKAIVREIFADEMAIVPYVMPGFALAKLAAEIAECHSEAKGLLLLQHGHFTWGKDAKESYDRVIEQTNRVEDWFANYRAGIQYQGAAIQGADSYGLINNLKKASNSIRGKATQSLIFNLIDDPSIIMQIDQHIARGVTGRGVATPDHVIRIKGKPLVLTRADQLNGLDAITRSIMSYISDYEDYFEKWSIQADSPKIMIDPMPKLVWAEGVGLFGIGSSVKEAKMFTDLGVQNVRVITDSEMAGGFYPVANKDLFDMEYWSLEQAKLGRASPLPLQGKVTLVTGAGGAIGAAIVNVFSAAGAEVIAVDINRDALIEKGFSSKVLLKQLDITHENLVDSFVTDTVKKYGGIDILVSNAGIATQVPMLEMDTQVLRDSFEINFFAHFYLAKSIGRLFIEQGNKGQMLFNISKQAVNPGRNFGAYGLPKATLMFLVKQLALELGNDGIRVNGVNADRIRSGLLNENIVLNRAAARGVTVDEYMTGNLLKQEVEPHHVAAAFFHLALSDRTTGHVITVDGGNIEASLR